MVLRNIPPQAFAVSPTEHADFKRRALKAWNCSTQADTDASAACVSEDGPEHCTLGRRPRSIREQLGALASIASSSGIAVRKQFKVELLEAKPSVL